MCATQVLCADLDTSEDFSVELDRSHGFFIASNKEQIIRQTMMSQRAENMGTFAILRI